MSSARSRRYKRRKLSSQKESENQCTPIKLVFKETVLSKINGKWSVLAFTDYTRRVNVKDRSRITYREKNANRKKIDVGDDERDVIKKKIYQDLWSSMSPSERVDDMKLYKSHEEMVLINMVSRFKLNLTRRILKNHSTEQEGGFIDLMNKDLLVEETVNRYFGREGRSTKLSNEEMNLGDLNKFRFFRLSNIMVPFDLINRILSFLSFNKNTLFEIGRVNKSFYLAILSSWTHLTIRKSIVFTTPLIVLRNVRSVTFEVSPKTPSESHSFSTGELDHILENLNSNRVHTVTLSCRPSMVKRLFLHLQRKRTSNSVFRNVRNFFYSSDKWKRDLQDDQSSKRDVQRRRLAFIHHGRKTKEERERGKLVKEDSLIFKKKKLLSSSIDLQKIFSPSSLQVVHFPLDLRLLTNGGFCNVSQLKLDQSIMFHFKSGVFFTDDDSEEEEEEKLLYDKLRKLEIVTHTNDKNGINNLEKFVPKFLNLEELSFVSVGIPPKKDWFGNNNNDYLIHDVSSLLMKLLSKKKESTSSSSSSSFTLSIHSSDDDCRRLRRSDNRPFFVIWDYIQSLKTTNNNMYRNLTTLNLINEEEDLKIVPVLIQQVPDDYDDFYEDDDDDDEYGYYENSKKKKKEKVYEKYLTIKNKNHQKFTISELCDRILMIPTLTNLSIGVKIGKEKSDSLYTKGTWKKKTKKEKKLTLCLEDVLSSKIEKFKKLVIAFSFRCDIVEETPEDNWIMARIGGYMMNDESSTESSICVIYNYTPKLTKIGIWETFYSTVLSSDIKYWKIRRIERSEKIPSFVVSSSCMADCENIRIIDATLNWSWAWKYKWSKNKKSVIGSYSSEFKKLGYKYEKKEREKVILKNHHGDHSSKILEMWFKKVFEE